MTRRISPTEKKSELQKYRDLVLATLDYYLHSKDFRIKTEDFDSDEHYKMLKVETEEYFQKGSLSRLKQYFRDLTEMQLESGDWRFSNYLQEKTGIEIGLLDAFFRRVERIIEKGKITTDNQFYDVGILLDKLCQEEPIDEKRIEILNRLLNDYENKKR